MSNDVIQKTYKENTDQASSTKIMYSSSTSFDLRSTTVVICDEISSFNYATKSFNHLFFQKEVFPDFKLPHCEKAIDFGVIEFKETKSNHYNIYQKDLKAEFIVFYDHDIKRFFLVTTKNLSYLLAELKMNGIRTCGVRKMACFATSSILKIREVCFAINGIEDPQKMISTNETAVKEETI